MQTGKRAICAGPGNPPVLVDDTCCLKRAAKAIIQGAAYDNNLLCIGEKEVFVLDSVADKFMQRMAENGAVRLNATQLERLTKAAFTFKEGQGARLPACVGEQGFHRQRRRRAGQGGRRGREAGHAIAVRRNGRGPPFVEEEQMMPFLPIVRVKSVEEGIERRSRPSTITSTRSIIHSHDVENMTAMARALDTTLFIKNGPCMAGLGLGGEGYLSYSIATPTGEGVTNPRTFTRVRRCVMVDNLRIY